MDSVSETDGSTIYTPFTSSESTTADFKDGHGIIETVEPKPGDILVIKHFPSGNVITLFDGQVRLAHCDGEGSSEWVCIQHNQGHLGFRNHVAGRLLGYGEDWSLCCEATNHKQWEHFRAKKQPDGRYVLVMWHWWWGAQPVGVREENGVKKLAMVKSWESDEAIWEFIKV